MWFRLGAVCLGIAPLVAAEGTLRWLGWYPPPPTSDPFLSLRSTEPLFVLEPGAERFAIPEHRRTHFRPESFSARKPAGEYRIFCVGGSTVQGRPFAIETSFTSWLELHLRAAEPGRRWDVINCGGISYASYRLVPIVREVLAHSPDLLVIYTGHNEFLEDRSYGHLKPSQGAGARAILWLAQLRVCSFLRTGYRQLTHPDSAKSIPDGPVLSTEVEALLDYQGGLEYYHRDPAWRRDVIRHFRYNLERMVELARAAGVPVVVVNPVSNLRDSPPFKSAHRGDLTSDEREELNAAWVVSRRTAGDNPSGALAALLDAVRLDDQHAMLQYDLAKAQDLLGRNADALEAYVRAKELDICPLRILEPMHGAIRDVAHVRNVPLVDARALFEGVSDRGIPGSDWLVDHVHPSIRGHQLLAEALFEKLERMEVVRPDPGTEERRDGLYREHLDSLSTFYFAKGTSRLEALRKWAAGRVTRERDRK